MAQVRRRARLAARCEVDVGVACAPFGATRCRERRMPRRRLAPWQSVPSLQRARPPPPAADDGPAIQRAINAAAKMAGPGNGRAVLVPEGNYTLLSSVSIGSSYVVLRGAGVRRAGGGAGRTAPVLGCARCGWCWGCHTGQEGRMP